MLEMCLRGWGRRHLPGFAGVHAPISNSRNRPILFPASNSIEVGKYRVHVFVGKGDLRHFLVLGHLAFGELFLQFSWIEPTVDITHRWGSLERTLANGFDGVAAPAFLLKNRLASCLYLLRFLRVRPWYQTQRQSDAQAQNVGDETRLHLWPR